MKKIIHLLDFFEMQQGNARYACNHAVYPTIGKATLNPLEVTCRNCIREPNKALSKAIKEGIKI